MNTMDAVRIGFRVMRRHPRIGAVETLWRTAWTILVVLFVLLGSTFFLKNVFLSNFDSQALRSKVPALVSLVIQRLIARHGREVLNLVLFVSVMSSLMWWLFASLFRSVVMGLMFQAFQREFRPRDVESASESLRHWVRAYALRLGVVNFNFIFFTFTILLLSAAALGGALRVASGFSPSIGPWVFVALLTFSWTLLFLIGAVLDVVTDLAQIGVTFESLSFGAALRRAAQIIQQRLSTVIGITFILFVLRLAVGIVLGVISLTANFMLGATLPALVIPVSVLLGGLQNVLFYYLAIMNLASFAALFEPEQDKVATPLPLPGKVLYEH